MASNRPFTWKQVDLDYPEFMAWIRTQTPKNLAGPVDVDEYNQYKSGYGAYLQAQMALMDGGAEPTSPDPEA